MKIHVKKMSIHKSTQMQWLWPLSLSDRCPRF